MKPMASDGSCCNTMANQYSKHQAPNPHECKASVREAVPLTSPPPPPLLLQVSPAWSLKPLRAS